jgi:hypothetical protein
MAELLDRRHTSRVQQFFSETFRSACPVPLKHNDKFHDIDQGSHRRAKICCESQKLAPTSNCVEMLLVKFLSVPDLKSNDARR